MPPGTCAPHAPWPLPPAPRAHPGSGVISSVGASGATGAPPLAAFCRFTLSTSVCRQGRRW